MSDDTPKVTGRPSTYTPELASEICARVMLGETIRQICSFPAMPDERTIYRWLAAQDAFSQQYARARVESGHISADGVAETAEDVRSGKLAPDAGRVVIDALKWSAGKRMPKVYGEKLDIEHSGKIETRSDEQLNAQIAALVGKRGPNDADEKREAGTDNAS